MSADGSAGVTRTQPEAAEDEPTTAANVASGTWANRTPEITEAIAQAATLGLILPDPAVTDLSPVGSLADLAFDAPVALPPIAPTDAPEAHLSALHSAAGYATSFAPAAPGDVPGEAETAPATPQHHRVVLLDAKMDDDFAHNLDFAAAQATDARHDSHLDPWQSTAYDIGAQSSLSAPSRAEEAHGEAGRGYGEAASRDYGPSSALAKTDAVQDDTFDPTPTNGANPYIDTLVSGSYWKGAGPIYYFFGSGVDPNGGLTKTDDSDDPGAPYVGQSWEANEKAAFVQVLDIYSSVSGLTFQEAANVNDANIVWWQGTDDDLTGLFGRHNFPDGFYDQLYGEFNNDPSVWNANTLLPGGDAFYTIIHELGHGMGLAHPHDGGQNNPVYTEVFPGLSKTFADDANTGDFGLNQGPYTVMSYNSFFTYNPTVSFAHGIATYGEMKGLGAFDIAALQTLYGKNNSYNTGDDTYLLPTANKSGAGWMAIWDAGGNDTISAAGANQSVKVNLHNAELDPNVVAYDGLTADSAAGGYISGGTVAIDGGFTIANGAVIENAIGGGKDDKLTGNEANNKLEGGNGNDTLNGWEGTDTLIGGAGTDRLTGGAGADDLQGGSGNDTYDVDDTGDTITEAVGGGTDLINGSIDIHLEKGGQFDGQEIENVTLVNGKGDLDIFGNALNNVLTGNDGENEIAGGAGNDTITGGADDDYLEGGDGADKLDGGDGNDTLESNTSTSVSGDDDVDTLTGGKGDDAYIVYDATDKVVESITNTNGGGIDSVNAFITFSLASLANVDDLSLLGTTGSENLNGTGNALVNVLLGNFGDNVLDGGAGIDFFIGNPGDDTFILDRVEEGDAAHINEFAAGGIDTVKTAVLAIASAINFVENYTFTGTGAWKFTGNDLDNVITGAAGTDQLKGGKGDDTLDGGKGGDELTGGQGNDTFVIDSALDTVIEGGANGTHDKLVSSVAIDLEGATFGAQELEDVFLTGTAVSAMGNGIDNNLVGNDAANTLDGRGGDDRLAGGKGNDTYFLDTAGDQAFELQGEGIDTVKSALNIDFSGLNNIFKNQEIENITLLGAAAGGTGDQAIGNDLNNIIIGNELGNDLEGGKGNDTITGGSGDDSLQGGEGNDTLTSGGNTLNTVLTILDGGKGDDKMTGGTGNDQYVVDSTGDKVMETTAGAAGGTADEVSSKINFSLGSLANVENLTLIGGDNINGTGNAQANILTGNTGNNILDGGAGNDQFNGGDGDDTFVLDNHDEFTKVSDTSGNDTIKSSAFFTTADAVVGIENYWYTGSAVFKFDASAIAGNHALTGGSGADTLKTGGGDDTLDGGTGADNLDGGNGSDTYVIDNVGDKVTDSGGLGDSIRINRSVNLSISINAAADDQFKNVIEHVTLTGTAALNATGDGNANILVGNDAANILDGGTAADTLVGGKGNDTYITYDQAEKIFENDKEGTDTIKSDKDVDLSSFAGGAFIENIAVLTPLGNAGVTFTGNDLANVLTGGDGADFLHGEKGADTLKGDKGNDTYFVDDAGDKVMETLAAGAGGFDTVVSTINFSLAALANVENLSLDGKDDINGTGNALINTIVGNKGDNILDGGKGDDFLQGLGGDDTYVLDSLGEFNNTNVQDTAGGSDTIRSGLLFTTANALADIENYTYTGSAVFKFDLTDKAGFFLGVDHTIIGGSGADEITGADKNDTLDGGKGADKLNGGTGDTTFVVDNVGDKITDTGGNDTLLINRSINLTTSVNAVADDQFKAVIDNVFLTGTAALNATGNGGVNILTGNDGANILDGLGGADTLIGGKGNDTYKFDDANDKAIEKDGEGTDTILTKVDVDLLFPNFVGQEIENITAILGSGDHLFGGNALKNTLTGADGNDTLFGDAGDDSLIGGDGNDILQGDGGKDTLTGGKGDDIYIVFDTLDVVVESVTNAAGGGVDKVQSDVDFSLAKLVNIENLALTGGGSHDSFGTNAVNGTGNALANTLQGNDGDNILDGGAGNDTFIGNGGNDTFVIDNLAELGNISDSAGSDTIKTALLITEANAVADVENYWYTGSAAFTFDASGLTGDVHKLTGGSGADTLTGADKDDRLDGGTGADHLFGGKGDDTYVVDNLGDVVDDQHNNDTGDAVIINRSVNLETEFRGDIEFATLTGTTAIDAMGSVADNILIGNDGNNKLSGGLLGNDFLSGGKGDDTLTGGTDGDQFDYNFLSDRGTGKEVITDFSASDGDKLDLADLLTGLGAGNVTDAQTDGFLAFVDDGKGNTIVMIDADGSALAVSNFVTLVTVLNVADPNDVAANII